jgi:DNA-binding NarL/FixJ family response regulator
MLGDTRADLIGSNVKMLVVSAFDESLYAERALRAGAHGYINKRGLQDKILCSTRCERSSAANAT